jgi:hypothetical protein
MRMLLLAETKSIKGRNQSFVKNKDLIVIDTTNQISLKLKEHLKRGAFIIF